MTAATDNDLMVLAGKIVQAIGARIPLTATGFDSLVSVVFTLLKEELS